LLNGAKISECKDKKLKNTKSWATNILIKLHFYLKAHNEPKGLENPKAFVAMIKE